MLYMGFGELLNPQRLNPLAIAKEAFSFGAPGASALSDD